MRQISRVHAALALAFVTSGCATLRGTPEPIRVLVYNIHAGKDASGVDNLARVAEIVRDTRADIVMLQEVDNRTKRSGNVDQLGELRRLTGFSGVFGKTIDYDGGEYGIGVLTRWPVAAQQTVRLPVTLNPDATRSYEERAALVLTITAPSGPLEVIDTHLDASRDSSYRMQQTRFLLSLAERIKNRSGTVLMGGDLNSEPNSSVASLFGPAGWRDAFVECGKGGGFSFPAKEPVKRIDYLMITGTTACSSATVLDTQASDHRPVLFEVIRARR
jgi:endonuclease/exonuclease/phosphatase family metal-dependent hydrolase